MEAALPQARVVRLDPSRSVALDVDADGLPPAPPLAWVILVDDQNVDYVYEGNGGPPSMCVIARHFPALTAAQWARVLDFCRIELAGRYAATEAAGDVFDCARVWQLSIYDHTGACTRWRFRLEDGAALAACDDDGPLGWTTDVSAAKLYAALELGESLSSMYLRINDAVFNTATGDALVRADVVLQFRNGWAAMETNC